MRFQNPANGYIEEASAAPLWCLLFGCLYFAVKGIWSHAFIALVAAGATFGLSWLIYPFFATQIVRTSYLRRGWIELVAPGQGVANQGAPQQVFASQGASEQAIANQGAPQPVSHYGRNAVLTLLAIFAVIMAVSIWGASTYDHDHNGFQTVSVQSVQVNNGVPECRKNGPPTKLCFLKFGQVRVDLENYNDKALKRAVISSDDMKRDATDFSLAAGFLMLAINPRSTADQRGSLLKNLMVTSKSHKPTKWSGYNWQMDYSIDDAIRVVAERN